MDAPNSPYMNPPTPSPNPHSNREVHELENWILYHFPFNSVPGSVECVPASDLFNRLLPLNGSKTTQQSAPDTEDQVVEHCRRKYLEILGHYFDQHSVGGRLNFLPVKVLNEAHADAQQLSVQRFKTLCGDNKYDEPTTNRLGEGLKKFIEDSKVKIAEINWNNCLRYLECNKKNAIQKFCETCEYRFRLLFKGSDFDKFSYYKTSKIDSDTSTAVSVLLKSWTAVKNIAIPNLNRGQDSVLAIPQPAYNDDVAEALNKYRKDIFTMNNNRIEKVLHAILEKRFDVCMKNIENMVQTTKYLDEVTHDEINIHVTNFTTRFMSATNVIMSQICSSKQEEIKLMLNEKATELLNYGQNLLKTEINKEREALHLEGVNVVKDLFDKQPSKYRLKRHSEIYQQVVLTAFETAKRQCNSTLDGTTNSDEENTEIATTSGGASRQPLSVSSFTTSNICSREGQDNNETPVDDNSNDPEGTETLSGRTKRPKKDRKSRDKGETIIKRSRKSP